MYRSLHRKDISFRGVHCFPFFLFSFCTHSVLQFISRQCLHVLLIIHCLPVCLSLFCTLLCKNKPCGNSSPSDCHLYSAAVNIGGCRLKDDRWTEISVKWPWRIAENTDFCERGVEKHFVSGTVWKCSGIEGQFSVNRTLETNMTQNIVSARVISALFFFLFWPLKNRGA